MKINKLIQKATEGYPKIYYDFSKGVKVSKEKIRDAIENNIRFVVKDFKENKIHKSFTFMSTGKVFVLTYGYREKKTGTIDEIVVMVAKNFKEDTFFNIKID